ncbi:N-(5'-phosphoribosyl)anthranilate isomerase [Jannaschia sp. S6380]|uniref:N-(5'-phosphoribosyl)anthranilate isomerase n=1 Tax=Jannaschia sp. S6380 TaxID=2926408 RepID=UPI001FF6E9DE|nr:N-(5'-phosphoribosyl)anthranilate isomerase [Jannaschia sp. S6380]MCK0166820.1 N-(5'-phosphoribosyl)anthranilate isomerase [Jannaschia sp. S6380]
MDSGFLLIWRGQNWLQQIFSSQAARKGGIVRRAKDDIDRMIGPQAFLAEMRRRGYSVATGKQGRTIIFPLA